MTVSINTPNELLDLFKQRTKLTSDYQVTKVYSIPNSTVSRMRNNETSLSDYYIVYMCHIMKIDAAPVLGSLRVYEAKKKGDTEAVKVWQKFSAA